VPLDGLARTPSDRNRQGCGLMFALGLPVGRGLRRILCIGAHCDDIEIGCGGTLIQLQKVNSEFRVDWAILSGTAERQAESRAAMERLIAPMHRGQIFFGDLPDAGFPAEYARLKSFFSALRKESTPDLVFSHTRDDAHQDHRMVNEMTWGAFRDHLVLEYEVIKWDGDLRSPNAYVHLDADVAEAKIDLLMGIYGSQRSRDWFTADTFRSVMRIRGIECRSPSGLAEGFFARKFVLQSADPGGLAPNVQ
jgi:LmbE family N-acetylglucosaminyl deacetylase